MNRRDFFKTAAAPIAIAACGLRMTADQTVVTNIDATMFQVGDILHVPRTAETAVVRTIANGKLELIRHFGSGGPRDSTIEPNDTILLFGNIGRPPEDYDPQHEFINCDDVQWHKTLSYSEDNTFIAGEIGVDDE